MVCAKCGDKLKYCLPEQAYFFFIDLLEANPTMLDSLISYTHTDVESLIETHKQVMENL